jgi:hypothetical protein
MTAIVILRETRTVRNGFYLSGAAAYDTTFTICAVRWPGLRAIAAASIESKAPSQLPRFGTVGDAHDKIFGAWIAARTAK